MVGVRNVTIRKVQMEQSRQGQEMFHGMVVFLTFCRLRLALFDSLVHSLRFAFSYCKTVKEKPAFQNGTFHHLHRPTEAPPLREKPKRLALNPKFIAW